MSIQLVFLAFLFTTGTTPALPRSETVSWSIGNATSKVDGMTHGPVTFIWTFNKPVQYGAYLDGTPFVVWEDGLQLVSVLPDKKQEDLLLDGTNGFVVADADADATCINLQADRLPLDQRLNDPWWGGGADVWDKQPVALTAGDCIVTGRSRRDARVSYRKMIFTAIGVCNVVRQDMTGHYRPPIRMPRDLRAALLTPTEVSVGLLPSLNISQPKNWSGSGVTMNLSGAVGAGNADDLLNGPIANCGLFSYLPYEPANGMLNHNLSGVDDAGYQRNVSDRFATCLYTAFDPAVDAAKRQRSLNKFIQIGLDYYYMNCLGYPVWNGGGGHPDGIEGAITITGALLGDAAMTGAIKYQRFTGDAVGQSGSVYDMLSGYQGSFSRSEALYTLSPAAWKSGVFYVRTTATTLEDCIPRIDMADPDMVLNCDDVPYSSISSVDANISAITVSSAYQWKMYTQNVSTEQSRSWRFPPGGVLRIAGDTKIRKILNFQKIVGTDWTDSTWPSALGKGGVLLVHPALTAQEISALGSSNTLAIGVCSKNEAENDGTVLWESWPVTTLERAHESFFSTPVQDYLDNKLGDLFYWLPFYRLLDDPGAPGKKLYEESMTFDRVKRFLEVQRDAGTYQWGQFTRTAAYSLPDSQTMQALVRYYLLDDTMPSVFCKTYAPTDKMWIDP